MKADRLYAITLYLLNHKRASGRCLADTFEVSLRCIQRDMDTLSMAGVPIIAYSGVNGGYELQEGYKLPVALVKEQDHAIIAASLDSMESAGLHKEVQTAKLLFPKHEEDTLGVQLDFSVANETAIEQRRLLQSVIAARHSVTFQYTDAQGKQTKRFCEAVALIFRWYAWYLVGWDVDKQAYRMYKLVRMEQLQEAEHTNRKHPCLREILKQAALSTGGQRQSAGIFSGNNHGGICGHILSVLHAGTKAGAFLVCKLTRHGKYCTGAGAGGAGGTHKSRLQGNAEAV